MTTIHATSPARPAVATLHDDTTGDRSRPSARRPLVAVALAAAVAGGLVEAAGAVAVPSLTRDPAAEQARWEAFAKQLEEAIRFDDLWQQMHPEPR